MPLDSTAQFSRIQRSYEAAAFARYAAYQEEQDAFMAALEKCETLEDAFNTFGDTVKRHRNDSDVFDHYTLDGYDIYICEDCARLTDPGETKNELGHDQCPHCGFTYEDD